MCVIRTNEQNVFEEKKNHLYPRKNDGKPKKVKKERKKLVPTAHSNSQLVVAAAALPLPFNTSAPKIKQKETNYVKKEKKTKKNLLFKFTLKNVTGIDEENQNEMHWIILRTCNHLRHRHTVGIWRAFIWLLHSILTVFCVFRMNSSAYMHIGHWHSTSNMHQWIENHYPYTETPKWSSTLFCIPLRILFLLWIFIFFLHWKNTKKRKKSVDFPRLRYTNLTKKNAHT